MPAPVIIWLRRDLRLGDHAPFSGAVDEGRPVVPVYLVDHEDGAWRPGAASRWWLHQSLAALDTELASRGSRLVIRRGDPLDALRALCHETGADAVWWHRLYEPQAIRRDTTIKRALREAGIEARSYPGALLHEPATVKPYRVFTPFWKTVSAALGPQIPLPAPGRLPSPECMPTGESIDSVGLRPRTRWDSGLAATWSPGEPGALERLEKLQRKVVGRYAESRDYPAEDGVSRLSPHLHFGEVSPRQAWHAVAATDGADAWLRQLGWREFAHAILFHFPHTSEAPLQERYADFPWRVDYGALLEAWQEGRTGYPIVDAGLRELWATGWMHNRIRMVAASLLVKNLRIPWQEGARWFWDTLVDADLANNSLGWQWAAGCGADAAPYFRVFNPTRQQQRFDPDLDYIRRWVPEYGSDDYPAPVVDFAESRDDALAALKTMGGE